LRFRTPDWVDADENIRKAGAGTGYRHMCRFFSQPIALHPGVQDMDFYLRIDTDARITTEVTYDIFQWMDATGFDYAYRGLSGDNPTYTEGLYPLALEFLEENNLEKSELMLKFEEGGVYNNDVFYTNFEVARFDLLRDKWYVKYFEKVDRSGHFYYSRWGDAPVHTVGIAMIFPEEKVVQLRDFGYQHHPELWEPGMPDYWVYQKFKYHKDPPKPLLPLG